MKKIIVFGILIIMSGCGKINNIEKNVIIENVQNTEDIFAYTKHPKYMLELRIFCTSRRLTEELIEGNTKRAIEYSQLLFELAKLASN